MSQSLIIFDSSGKIRFQYDNKTIPFNAHISAIANETCILLDPSFCTSCANNKRFYSVKEENIYCSLYFDSISVIDSERIRKTLIDILKIYKSVVREEDEESEETLVKLRELINYQFGHLLKSKKTDQEDDSDKQREKATTSKASKKNMKNSQKKMRRWDNGELVDSVADSNALDFSNKSENQNEVFDRASLNIDQNAFTKNDDNLRIVEEIKDILNKPEESMDLEANTQSDFMGKLSSFFGTSVDVDEISKKFQDQLVSKNISSSTAVKITDKIKAKLGSKRGVNVGTYKQALIDELTKILTPNVSTDLLYEIKRNQLGRPYVISVVGVNGVGKSTNLAKLAYWLLQNDLNVLICACDTFRSGAVEQLKVHVNNLQKLNETNSSESKISLFEKGYGGGDHVVATARQAIQYAKDNKFNVVLIDTAGRTHSNAKLMAPLKKFGEAANPDRIIMVGEALVGTDSVAQALNFNNAFGNKRGLDFFIISKVDTVGELVGSMINMVMATNVPILFVGTGQTYTDIKRLSVKAIVNMLVS